MIKAIIIDDEKKSREVLSGLLDMFCKQVEVVAEADCVKTGLEVLSKHKTDVVFLDIQMPDGSCFKLLEKIEKPDFDIIFTTAYDQYAIQAIRHSALDYLLKPVIPDELQNAVKKIELKKQKENIEKNLEVLLSNIKSPIKKSSKIILSTAEKIHIIDINNILRCESDNYYTRFFFTNSKPILISKTLKENEELLSEHNFLRIHKSHLVNTKYIKSFIRNDGGYIVMSDGSEVPVSRRKREKVLEILHNI